MIRKKSAATEMLRQIFTEQLPTFKCRTFCLVTLGSACAADSDLHCVTFAVFIVRAFFCLAIHIDHTAYMFGRTVCTSASFLAEAGAERVALGCGTFPLDHNIALGTKMIFVIEAVYCGTT
jgi:hypothetical protein